MKRTAEPGMRDGEWALTGKIALFRSLFRGREDIYAIRFESRKSGKAGYMPACGNEWVRGLCEKPGIKCGRCPNRLFLAVTDDVIRCRPEGRDDRGREFVIGVYPMLQDETSWFLVVDFDKATWREDGRTFLETCRRMNLPAALEQSRSGNGAHIRLFFEEPIPAGLARRLGSHVLTETMERRPDLGLDSYDRLIPNQDTLPKGGLGSLIAPPLQKKPRESGCAVFLDENLSPYPDQWAYLARIRRLPRAEVEANVQAAETKGRVLGVRIAPNEEDSAPWTRSPSGRRVDPPISGPLPERLEIVLSNEVYLGKEDLPPLCAIV